MDAIRPNSIQENGLERQRGFVGIASQLIRYDEAYKNVFANLLGRVIIAEDMDSAIAIARAYRHRYRIVTLDGQVLNAGGSMTGGSVSRSAGILSRSNELERLPKADRRYSDPAGRGQKRSCRSPSGRNSKPPIELEKAQNEKHELDSAVLRLEGEAGQYEILISGLERAMAGCQEGAENTVPAPEKDRGGYRSRPGPDH